MLHQIKSESLLKFPVDFNEFINLLQKGRHGVACVVDLAFFVDFCVGMIDLCPRYVMQLCPFSFST